MGAHACLKTHMKGKLRTTTACGCFSDDMVTTHRQTPCFVKRAVPGAERTQQGHSHGTQRPAHVHTDWNPSLSPELPPRERGLCASLGSSLPSVLEPGQRRSCRSEGRTVSVPEPGPLLRGAVTSQRAPLWMGGILQSRDRKGRGSVAAYIGVDMDPRLLLAPWGRGKEGQQGLRGVGGSI